MNYRFEPDFDFLKGLCLFVCFLYACTTTGQVGLQIDKVKVFEEINLEVPETENFKTKTKAPVPFLKAALTNPLPLNQVPNVFDANDLAFFCRIELKLEKALQFPFKFRLGEVQQVEAKERKYPSSRIAY